MSQIDIPTTATRRETIERALETMVIAAALITIPLVIAEESVSDPESLLLLHIADWIVWFVFVIHYGGMMLLSTDRKGFFRSNLLGLAVIIFSFPVLPTILDLLRLARLVRIARMALVAGRALRALHCVLGRTGVVYVLASTALLILVGSGLLILVEPEKAPGGFMDGVWWAIVTVTTVGYGDISPSTIGGRLVAVCLMFAGMGLIASLAASLAAYFVEQDEGRDITEIREKLDRIENELARLNETLARDAKN